MTTLPPVPPIAPILPQNQSRNWRSRPCGIGTSVIGNAPLFLSLLPQLVSYLGEIVAETPYCHCRHRRHNHSSPRPEGEG
jgi:hypothetical protein